MEHITLYLKERGQKIFALSSDPLLNNAVFFRNLRVEIKKLRAVFNLIAFCQPKFNQKKRFLPFKILAQQTGKIRDLQVEEEMLTKYFSEESAAAAGYKQNLQLLLQKEQEAFLSVLKAVFIPTEEQLVLKVEPFIKKIQKKQLTACIKQQQKDIKKLLFKKNIAVETLHLLRKKLKIYYYNRNMLGLQQPKKFLSGKKVLPKLLGDWHNCEVAALQLKKAVTSGILSKKEVRLLKKIHKKIVGEEKAYLSEIKTVIREMK